MSEKYKVIDSTFPTFITTTIVDWVDLFVPPLYEVFLKKSCANVSDFALFNALINPKSLKSLRLLANIFK